MKGKIICLSWIKADKEVISISICVHKFYLMVGRQKSRSKTRIFSWCYTRHSCCDRVSKQMGGYFAHNELRNSFSYQKKFKIASSNNLSKIQGRKAVWS